MVDFSGFPQSAFTFYEGLEQDNSKDYWEAHRETWESSVQAPMQELVALLETEFPPLRTFRPNRDVRFAKDKSPYKTWAGISSTPRAVGGIGFFFRLEASGLRMACGAMVMASDQIERFRSAVVHDKHGKEFAKLVEKQAAAGLPITGGKMEPLKRPPSGFPKDHPRAEFLRWKGAVIVKEYGRAKWMSTPEAFHRVREVWHGSEDLKRWLDVYVGPSEEPAPSRGRRG
jgi:uncharacterized protein (TIGR02453 family)